PYKWEEGNKLYNKINQRIHNLEVPPKVTIAYLEETDKTFGDKSFYVILKVVPEIKNRPYMLKNGCCYIRLGSTNQPVWRSVVIDLCKQTIDRTTVVTHLEAASSMLTRQLQHIREQAIQMSQKNREFPFFLPVMDLSLFKQAAANCMWFLV